MNKMYTFLVQPIRVSALTSAMVLVGNSSVVSSAWRIECCLLSILCCLL